MTCDAMQPAEECFLFLTTVLVYNKGRPDPFAWASKRSREREMNVLVTLLPGQKPGPIRE